MDPPHHHHCGAAGGVIPFRRTLEGMMETKDQTLAILWYGDATSYRSSRAAMADAAMIRPRYYSQWRAATERTMRRRRRQAKRSGSSRLLRRGSNSSVGSASLTTMPRLGTSSR